LLRAGRTEVLEPRRRRSPTAPRAGGERKTGQRTEGATYAIFSFTRKITQPIGGALGAFALAIGGYITKPASGQLQPESAILAIKATIGLLPATAAVIAMICFIAYPLTEKIYAEIVEENDARKREILQNRSVPTVPIPPGI
jgi:glucuronide carrier protein